MLPAAARRSLVETTIEILRGRVAGGRWPVGERIPREADLMAQLGVSRNTVREAVRALSQSGMLDGRQGDGTYVRQTQDPMETIRRVGRADLQDHLELRCLLESECARLAARRRTEDDLRALEAALARRGRWTGGQSFDAFIEADRAFHIAVAAASRNKAFEELYRYFSATIAENMAAALGKDGLTECEYEQHVAMLDAIRDRDEAAAHAANLAILRPLVRRVAAEGGAA